MSEMCATLLLLVIILERANAYSRALVTLHLSGTVYLLLFIHAIQDGTESDGEMIEEEQSIMHELMPM